MDLFELLANGGDNEATYRAQNPWYQAGGAVFQQPLPAPRSSTEAFLGPILQGLAGGTMLGYGRRQADQAAYEDYRNNPLFEALKGSEDPGAQTLMRSYQGEEAPEGWTARQGKRDTILAALRQSIAQEERMADIEGGNQLERLLAGKGVMIGSGGQIVPIPGLAEAEANAAGLVEDAKRGNDPVPGVPKGAQTAALGEQKAIADKDLAKEFANAQFEQAKEINSFKASISGTTAANEMEGISNSLATQVQRFLGREMSAVERSNFLKLLPDWNDTKSQIQKKQERFNDMLDAFGGATPVLDAAGLTTSKKEAASISQADAIAELRRRGVVP